MQDPERIQVIQTILLEQDYIIHLPEVRGVVVWDLQTVQVEVLASDLQAGPQEALVWEVVVVVQGLLEGDHPVEDLLVAEVLEEEDNF